MLIYFQGLYDAEPEKEKNITIEYNKNLNNDEMQKGSIRYRLDKKIYEARFRANNKQYSIYAKTKKDCALKFKATLKEKQNNIEDKNTYTLYEWLDKWYEIYKKPNLKESSLYQINICINKHIKQNIANINLKKLTAINIDIMLNKIKTSRMKKYTFDVICEALKQAYKNKVIKDNITENINTVKHNRQIGKALTIKEQKQFLDKIKNSKYENLFIFYLNSGLRKSELLNLKWQDINFENETIKINGTKTQNSVRTIPLFNILKNVLNSTQKTTENIFNISSDRLQKVFNQIKKIKTRHNNS